MLTGRLLKEQAHLCSDHGGDFQCDIAVRDPGVVFDSLYVGETSGKVNAAEECHIWIDSRVGDPDIDGRGRLTRSNRDLHNASLPGWGLHRHPVGPGLI